MEYRKTLNYIIKSLDLPENAGENDGAGKGCGMLMWRSFIVPSDILLGIKTTIVSQRLREAAWKSLRVICVDGK